MDTVNPYPKDCSDITKVMFDLPKQKDLGNFITTRSSKLNQRLIGERGFSKQSQDIDF